MSEQVTGKISKKFYKDWTGKQGQIVLCSFQLESSNRYFRTGTTDLSQSEGQHIKFLADQKGNVDLSTVAVVEAADVQRAPAPAPSSGGGNGGKVKENWDARADYWSKKEKRDVEVVEPRITLSASQSVAATLVVAALENDCLSFGGVAKGKKLDMLLDFFDQVTDRLYEQRMNMGAGEEPSAIVQATEEGSNDY